MDFISNMHGYIFYITIRQEPGDLAIKREKMLYTLISIVVRYGFPYGVYT